jgi:hypothetical protein
MKCDYCGEEISSEQEIINVGEKNVCSKCFNQSIPQGMDVQKDVSKRNNKYPALQFNISFQKGYGWLIIIGSVILLISFLMSRNFVNVLFCLGGVLFGMFVIALGEIFQVFVDIEKNTRK